MMRRAPTAGNQRYAEWLRMLFMLLATIGQDGSNLFEGVIRGLLENRASRIGAFLAAYDQPCVQLSDRGFSQPVADSPQMMAMSFNLCSTAFVDIAFADPALFLHGRANTKFAEHALENWKRRAASTFHLTVTHNDRSLLALQNRRVVEQCNSRV